LASKICFFKLKHLIKRYTIDAVILGLIEYFRDYCHYKYEKNFMNRLVVIYKQFREEGERESNGLDV
jgi:hypothetical protein